MPYRGALLPQSSTRCQVTGTSSNVPACLPASVSGAPTIFHFSLHSSPFFVLRWKMNKFLPFPLPWPAWLKCHQTKFTIWKMKPFCESESSVSSDSPGPGWWFNESIHFNQRIQEYTDSTASPWNNNKMIIKIRFSCSSIISWDRVQIHYSNHRLWIDTIEPCTMMIGKHLFRCSLVPRGHSQSQATGWAMATLIIISPMLLFALFGQTILSVCFRVCFQKIIDLQSIMIKQTDKNHRHKQTCQKQE